jgi:hypothetical protein
MSPGTESERRAGTPRKQQPTSRTTSSTCVPDIAHDPSLASQSRGRKPRQKNGTKLTPRRCPRTLGPETLRKHNATARGGRAPPRAKRQFLRRLRWAEMVLDRPQMRMEWLRPFWAKGRRNSSCKQAVSEMGGFGGVAGRPPAIVPNQIANAATSIRQSLPRFTALAKNTPPRKQKQRQGQH